MPENPGKKAAFTIMGNVHTLIGSREEPPIDKLLRETDSILDNWIRVIAWLARSGKYADEEPNN
jgi:hypothetical protein